MEGIKTQAKGQPTKVQWCPIFEPRHVPHEWAQVDAYHTEQLGGRADLVRCVYCLTYLEVVRP